jgi:hypothetical protein
MIRSLVPCTVLALCAALALGSPQAQLGGNPEPPGDHLILVQAELDHLAAAKQPITLDVEHAAPAAVLGEIARKSGITIEVRGSLPGRPALTASYRDASAKTVLTWFAGQVPVSFRAEPPNKLWVIVEPSRPAE